MRLRYIGLAVLWIMCATISQAQRPDACCSMGRLYIAVHDLEQRVGQLFMERAFSKDPVKDRALAKKQIEEYHIGGLCFFKEIL